MALPTLVYINSSPFYIYQKQYQNFGTKEKKVVEERTITGKRSRQLGWGPRSFSMTLWLTPDNKVTLDSLWESETNSQYTANLQIDLPTSYTYTVTFDEYSINPLEAVEERWLATVKFTEWL